MSVRGDKSLAGWCREYVLGSSEEVLWHVWLKLNEVSVLVRDSVVKSATSMKFMLQNKWYHTLHSAVLNGCSREGASLAVCSLLCGKQLHFSLHTQGIGCSTCFPVQPAGSGHPCTANERLWGFQPCWVGIFSLPHWNGLVGDVLRLSRAAQTLQDVCQFTQTPVEFGLQLWAVERAVLRLNTSPGVFWSCLAGCLCCQCRLWSF